MKHRILCTSRTRAPFGCVRLIKRAIRRTLEIEHIAHSCTIGVLLTGPDEIRQLNGQLRATDSVTDVLSFPALQVCAGKEPEPDVSDRGNSIYLGDMAINLERAREQAGQYGHSLSRETAYLAVHSTLHLLGYDHMDEAEQKKLMRTKEESILKSLSLTREEERH